MHAETSTSRRDLPRVSPVVAVFLSSNVVNIGNFLFALFLCRWMGPALFAELAFLLTIQMIPLTLAFALQMAVSEAVSRCPNWSYPEILSDIRKRTGSILLIGFAAISVPVCVSLFRPDIISVDMAALFVIMAFPFAGPMALERGAISGRMSIGRMIATAQLEIALRLFGGLAAWSMGLGLTGVAAVISLSLVIGWLSSKEVSRVDRPAPFGFWQSVRKAGLPVVILGAAQIVMLEGDVILSTLLLEKRETGAAAVLAVIQRFQFFSCAGLAIFLLPTIAKLDEEGRATFMACLSSFRLFVVVSGVFLAAVILVPGDLIKTVAGWNYARATEVLPVMGLCAVGFSAVYLLVTVLIALGDLKAVILLLIVSLSQAAFAVLLSTTGVLDLSLLFAIKLAAIGLILPFCAFRLKMLLSRKALIRERDPRLQRQKRMRALDVQRSIKYTAAKRAGVAKGLTTRLFE